MVAVIGAINAAAQIWYRYMTSAAIQATLLTLILLGIAMTLRRRSPALRHALLMVALLKFVIPPTLPLPTGIFSQLGPDTSPKVPPAVQYVSPIVKHALWLSEDTPASIPEALPHANQPARAVPSLMSAKRDPIAPMAWLMGLHLLGALVILVLAIYQRAALGKIARRSIHAEDPDLLTSYGELCEKLKVMRRPQLVLSAGSHAPMTFGNWKPVIVLPESLVAALPMSEIRVILGHELAHQRRWDLWLSWLQVPISALWWFNPVYWLLVRRIRGVREDCCDDLVVASGLATGEAYCETLLQAARVASGRALAGASLAYIGESQSLRRRFRRIMGAKIISKPKLAWVGILIVVLAGLLFLPGIKKHMPQNTTLTVRPQVSTVRPNQAAAAPESPAVLPAPVPEQSSRQLLFRVVDTATGLAIQGAALHADQDPAIAAPLSDQEPKTDKDGRCAAAVVAPGTYVTVRANGYVPRMVRFGNEDEIPAEYTFRLGKGVPIGGYVRDDKSNPIANVQITVYEGYSTAQSIKDSGRESFARKLLIRSDEAGRWTCNEINPDLEYVDLHLAHAEYVQTDYSTKPSSLTVKQQALDFDELKSVKAILIMKYGMLISGTVYDDRGRPVENASVFHIEQRRRISSAVTGPDGRFRFSDGKPGEATLKVLADGFAPLLKDFRIAPRMPEIECRLAKGQVVRGRVVDDEGNPIEGAQVHTLSLGPNDEFGTPWQTKTDAAGRFYWDSAPVSALNYMVSAEGFIFRIPPVNADKATLDSMINDLSLEPGKDHEIKLHRLPATRVSGKVIDATTKMPIDKFKATATSVSAPPRSAEGVNGEFNLSLNALNWAGDRLPKITILVEADGYRPDDSQTIDFTRGDWKLEFALVRGTGPSGTVTLPNGEPVSQANVFLCGGYVTNMNPGFSQEKVPIAPAVNSIKSVMPMGSNSFASASTDESGRFSFTPVLDPLTVIATHEKGFASVTVEQLASSQTITLQPWGRVEGVIRIGTKPAAGQRLTLRSMFYGRTAVPPGYLVQMSAQSDTDGKYVFPAVPPGEYRIIQMQTVPAAGESQSAVVAVHSGQTTTLLLGGRGRPIIGRVAAVGADSPVDWKNARGTVKLKVPEIPQPDPRDMVAYQKWSQTEEARKWGRAQHSYPVGFAADGSFRVEDIDTGVYVLTVTLRIPDPARPVGPGKTYTVTKEFTVGELAGGRSDNPFDLGTLIIQINSQTAALGIYNSAGY